MPVQIKHFIYSDRAGDYELSLVVNDGQQDSQTTTVKLQVFARNTEQVVNPSDVIPDPKNDDVLVDNTEEKGKVIFRDGFVDGDDSCSTNTAMILIDVECNGPPLLKS